MAAQGELISVDHPPEVVKSRHLSRRVSPLTQGV